MAEHVGMGEEDLGQFDADRDVAYVTGAAMALRRADLEALGGMDEEFFPAYYEETDLCTRLRRSGLRVVCVGAALGWHHESVGLARGSSRFVETSYRRRIVYVVKNYSAGEWLARFWPFELRWVLGPHARGFRGPWARSLAWGAVFAVKCLLRFNRRPGGVHARLPGAK
jgi:GT2 family glycosyltransferase